MLARELRREMVRAELPRRLRGPRALLAEPERGVALHAPLRLSDASHTRTLLARTRLAALGALAGQPTTPTALVFLFFATLRATLRAADDGRTATAQA